MKCDLCHDTGWYGDNGPGIKGNRESYPCECRSKGNPIPNAYPIGTRLIDEDGNKGIVCIRWNDGDTCWIENDTSHPNPRVMTTEEEARRIDMVRDFNKRMWYPGGRIKGG